MEVEKTLSLTRQELADLLKGIASQLEAGGSVRSEALNNEVVPQEPILVKLEYEDKVATQKIEIDIHLIGSSQAQPQQPQPPVF